MMPASRFQASSRLRRAREQHLAAALDGLARAHNERPAYLVSCRVHSLHVRDVACCVICDSCSRMLRQASFAESSFLSAYALGPRRSDFTQSCSEWGLTAAFPLHRQLRVGDFVKSSKAVLGGKRLGSAGCERSPKRRRRWRHSKQWDMDACQDQAISS